ncbi:hypothetical protein K469DRAFT_748431 [Zopfia rhizophila CBS 207.26]|uniref:C2H2-type domain-containing protein n=1 Tax=Zopfia rhizophila CBS 207.26 TaxID=1314779 RepID=A0A6A6E9R6_9PEZI|nr:hypothetical protein K469DRAFT_748431 [Zopfia rhizophila CBS 207.26]
MDEGQDFPEESLAHIEALLSRHPPQEIMRMFQQVLDSRRNSSASSFTSSNSSLRSRLSIASSFSISSREFAPSIASSTSSRSRRRQEPRSYPSGLNPTRPVSSVHTPVSDVSSPMDSNLEPSITPTDEDLNSMASPIGITNERAQSQVGDSHWFCTFCAEKETLKTFRAKSDWKKHETRMHETGEDWPCPAPGCSQIFDRQKDFTKHYERSHPKRPLLSLTDIKIQLLPKKIFGCGFDKCKDVSIGWDERCDHVAKHMKNGLTSANWKYSNVIRNLIRQEATRDTWKELISSLDESLRESRSQINWSPENTRILKQKLECCDLRPSREEVLITALGLRSDLPIDARGLELPPGFVIPSKDSVENFDRLSREQRMHILNGESSDTSSRARLLDNVTSALLKATSTAYVQSQPAPARVFVPESQPYSEPQITDAHGRRISFMEVDPADFVDIMQPDISQIPTGLGSQPAHQPEQDSGFIDPGRPTNPLGWCYPNYFGPAPVFEESQYYDRPSLGQIMTKPLRKVRSGLSSRRTHQTSAPSPVHQTEAVIDFTVPHAAPIPMRQQQQYRAAETNVDQSHLFTSQY